MQVGVFSCLAPAKVLDLKHHPCKKQSRWTDQAVFQGAPLVPLNLYDIEIPQIS